MALSDAQRDGFDRRISRIKKGAGNTAGTIEVGPRDEVRAKDGKPTAVKIKKKKKKNATLGEGSTSVLFLLAIFFGGMSMFVGQAAGFHFFEEGGLVPIEAPHPAIEPYIGYAPILIGGILALALGWTFRMTQGIRFIGLLGGFGAVFYYKLQLMQQFPGLYAGFFSKPYVQSTLAAVAAG